MSHPIMFKSFQVEAQIKGWKNKLFYCFAFNLEHAIQQARIYFHNDSKWKFRIQDIDTDEYIFTDPDFDPKWEE